MSLRLDLDPELYRAQLIFERVIFGGEADGDCRCISPKGATFVELRAVLREKQKSRYRDVQVCDV